MGCELGNVDISFRIVLFILCFVVSQGWTYRPQMFIGSSRLRLVTSSGLSLIDKTLGGDIVVSEVGNYDEDEGFLTALHQQSVWKSIRVITSDMETTKKRFLSRSARYSGLLDSLAFHQSTIDPTDKRLSSVLQEVGTWIALDVPRHSIRQLAHLAIECGVRRVVFSTNVRTEGENAEVSSDFEDILDRFNASGYHFTGIRHGDCAPGDENVPYEIVEGNTSFSQPIISRGVLGRVAAELLRLPASFNKECGVSNADALAASYLTVLRSSGLTKNEEVYKMFTGGLQRITKLRKERLDAASRENTTESNNSTSSDEPTQLPDKSVEDPFKQLAILEQERETEQQIHSRAEQILQETWRAFNGRMLTRTTSKSQFFDDNRKLAFSLAMKEHDKRVIEDLRQKASIGIVDTVASVEEEQYARLLALERNELMRQREVSVTWLKFVYMLLRGAVERCSSNDINFFEQDTTNQTALLLQEANWMRERCGLPTFSMIYDPLDAPEMLAKAKNFASASVLEDLQRPSKELLNRLRAQFDAVLNRIPVSILR